VVVPNLASVLDILLMRQFFRTLAGELEEVALLDGGARMQIF
jgi:ABC-type glycerol-3-phosphate transport system permease component